MNYEGTALTIAGSDSGGGAGIQADIKTFQAFNVYGMSVITSVTAQNTRSVYSVYDLPADIIGAQIDAVMNDIGVNGVKTGMLSTEKIIMIVVDRIKKYKIKNLVVDPVMVSKSSYRLLQKEAEKSLEKELLPVTFLVTPNVPEAEIISGISIKNIEDARKAAQIIQKKGPEYVLLKGGHLQEKEAVDILFDGDSYHYYKSERIDTLNTHGTGCTYSAAITSGLAKRMNIYNAIETAKDYITRAIKNAPDNLGAGNGPLYHKIKPLLPLTFKGAGIKGE